MAFAREDDRAALGDSQRYCDRLCGRRGVVERDLAPDEVVADGLACREREERAVPRLDVEIDEALADPPRRELGVESQRPDSNVLP